MLVFPQERMHGMERLNEIIAWLGKHGGTLGLIATWVGIFWVYLRRRFDWRQKQFTGQVNFSLNYLANNTLAMRTLRESTVQDVWLNDYGIKLVLDAARRTTEAQPFIRLPNVADMQFLNRAALNALSECFASTYVAEALGLPVKTGRFIFGITYERYDIMRTFKFRVLLMEEESLKGLFGPDGTWQSLEVKSPILQARLRTLKVLHDLYVAGQATGEFVVERVNLGVVLAAPAADQTSLRAAG